MPKTQPLGVRWSRYTDKLKMYFGAPVPVDTADVVVVDTLVVVVVAAVVVVEAVPGIHYLRTKSYKGFPSSVRGRVGPYLGVVVIQLNARNKIS